MDNPTDRILHKLNQRLREQAQRGSEIHDQFLKSRQVTLDQFASMLKMQLHGIEDPSSLTSLPPQRPDPLFTAGQMAEFATGSMARCFGPEFEIYTNRRHPRIPNGDLMLMSRALEITGERRQFNKPAAIVTEYDVPPNAWYFRDNSSPFVPYSVWMEMALQPCGFLSAYLGTPLMFPEIDFFFRNLDGSATLLSDMDVRGQTIRCEARLLSTLAGGETIIQRFTFKLSCQGVPLYEGWSIFGFFPPEAMAAQAGLDAGTKTYPDLETSPETNLAAQSIDLSALSRRSERYPNLRLPTGQLQFLDRALRIPSCAAVPFDRVVAYRENHPSAWFYSCHFHHDPVMPGSLGVEAILQAIQAYALDAGLDAGLGREFNNPSFRIPINQPLTWKYRGQILPSHRQMKLEVQVKSVQETGQQFLIAGDASLWADDVRIYEIKNAAIVLAES